jgi:hypothetical protein
MLKDFPENADVGALIQLAMDMTQTALLRVYEIVELEQRPLTESESRALDAMIDQFKVAEQDALQLKKRRAN